MIRAMQRRLTAVLLLFLVGVYVGFCAVSYASSAGAMEQESDRMLRHLAEEKSLDQGEEPERGQMPDEPLGLAGRVGLPYFILRTDQAGAVVEVEQGQFAFSEDTALQDMVDQALAMEEESGYLGAYGLRCYRQALPNGWKLVFADDSLQREARLRQIQGSVLLGLGLLPVFLLFSWLLSSFVARPVRRAWEQQAQFVADASHELKTPLTVILSNTDMILADCPPEDRPLHSRAENVRLEAERMRELTLDLLELARSDERREGKCRLERVDFSCLAEAAALAFEAVAYERGLVLETDLAPGVAVRGTEKGLSDLLRILLDNAVKYGSPGGTVAVRLAAERGKAVLRVANPSQPLAPEQLERVFDRFYRADEARSLQPGYGLGLSMARQIVTACGGRIWAEHRAGITTLTVQLQLEKASRQPGG